MFSEWGNKGETEWFIAAKEEYKQMDRKVAAMEFVKDKDVLMVGEVHEIMTKAMLSPKHMDSVVEGLLERGTVLGEKRNLTTEKHSKCKRKLIETPTVDE